MRNYLFFLAFMFLSYHINAQETGEQSFGAWYTYGGSHKISNKLSLNSLAQLWLYETTGNFNLGILLAGVNYHVNPQLTGSLGYAYLNIDPSFEELYEQTNIGEHRLFEEIKLKNKVGKVSIFHRYRLEQRFMDFGDRTDFQQRMRYRFQTILPLTRIFFINIYDEIILNLQNEAFSQNRLYAALGIKCHKSLSVQMGYLKNHFRTKAYDRFQLGIFIRTDLRVKGSLNNS